MEILKMRFSIIRTFQLISRTFHFFWDDIDLSGDLDLCSKVIKIFLCTPEYKLNILTKNEVDPTSGLGRVCGMTDRQKDGRTLS